MVDSWPSELLLGDRLHKPSDRRTYLGVFFFPLTTQIPLVSVKRYFLEVDVPKSHRSGKYDQFELRNYKKKIFELNGS